MKWGQLCFLTALSLCSMWAGAQPCSAANAENSNSPQTERGGTIIVIADGELGSVIAQLLEATIASREIPIEVLRRDPSTSSPLARDEATITLRIDSSSSTKWDLVLKHRRRIWRRKVEGPATNAAAEEAVAVIAADASIAILEEGHAAPLALDDWQEQAPKAASLNATKETSVDTPLKKVTTKEDRTNDEKPAAEPRAFHLPTSVAYRGELYAQGVFVHGMHLNVDLRHQSGFFGGVGLTLAPHLNIESDYGSFELSRLPVDLRFGYCFHKARWHLCPEAGLVLDPSRRTQAQGSSGVGVTESDSQFSLGFTFGAHAEFRLTNWLSLLGGVSALASLSQTEFIVSSSENALLSPYHFRPRARLGVLFPF